jgi:hypothetical protein
LAAILRSALLGIVCVAVAQLASPDAPAVSAAPAAAPTPTYVSELAPAVMVPPREPATLPATGARVSGASVPWSHVAGFAVLALGATCLHAGLRLRPRRDS